jgi:hypothetical protein
LLPAFDPVIYGRAVQAARIMRGLALPELAHLLRDGGVMVTTRQLRRIESGVMVPPFDVFVGLVVVLKPHTGIEWFRQAVRRDWAQSLRDQA